MAEVLTQEEAIQRRNDFLRGQGNNPSLPSPPPQISDMQDTTVQGSTNRPLSQQEALEMRRQILERKANVSRFTPQFQHDITQAPLQGGLSSQQLTQVPEQVVPQNQFQMAGAPPVSQTVLPPQATQTARINQAPQTAIEPQKREVSIRAQEPVSIRAQTPQETQKPVQNLTPEDIASAQINLLPEEERKKLSTEPTTSEQFGFFKGKAAEFGRSVGAPFIGQTIEDLANPIKDLEFIATGKVLSSPIVKDFASKLAIKSMDAISSVSPALETAGKFIGKTAAKIGQALDKFDINRTPVSTEQEPIQFPLRNIFQRAMTALESIAPGVSREDAINSIIANSADRNVIPGTQAYQEARRKAILLLGSGDRDAGNQAIDVLQGLVPDKVFLKIKNINPDADVGLVMNRLGMRFSNNIQTEIGSISPSTAREVDDNIRLVAKALEAPRSGKLWSFVKDVMKDDLSLENLSKVKKATKIVPINPELEKLSQEGSMNDISLFQRSTLDLDRISTAVDKTGTVSRTLYRPLVESEIASREATRDYIENFLDRFPSFKPKSKNSFVLRRFIEGNSLPEDAPLIDNNMRRMAAELRNEFNANRIRVNNVRTKIGKVPIPSLKDYVTQFRELSILDELFGGMANVPDKFIGIGSEFAKPNSPFFASALKRMGGKNNNDAISGLFRYVSGVNKAVYTTDPIMNIRANSRFLPPVAADTFNKFANAVAGKNPAKSLIDDILTAPVLGKFLEFSNRQFINNVIIGNTGPIISQVQSLPFIAHQTGFKNMLLGIMDLASPEKEAFAIKNSLGVRTRFLETDWNPSGLNLIQNVMNGILTRTDTAISKIAFFAGLRKAAEEGLKDDAAMHFADRVVNRSNAIYSPANNPLILKNRILKLVFPIQTMTFNSMNFLKEDIAKGLMNNPNKPEEMKKLAEFLGTAFGINTVAYAAALMVDSNLRNVFTWTDFMPFFRMARTDYRGQLNIPIGAFEAPTKIAVGLGGLFSDTEFERKKALGKIGSGAATLLLPGGGLQIERLMRGNIFPHEQGELKKTGTEAAGRILGF